VNPGLHPTLHLYCSGRWIDPPGSQKEQREERPQKRHTDDKP